MTYKQKIISSDEHDRLIDWLVTTGYFSYKSFDLITDN
jgi:hypothetical protein